MNNTEIRKIVSVKGDFIKFRQASGSELQFLARLKLENLETKNHQESLVVFSVKE